MPHARRPPRRTLRVDLLRRFLVCVALVGLVGWAGSTAHPAAARGLTTTTFGYTGAIQTWTVPSGVQSVTFALAGGAGGAGVDGTFTYSSTATGILVIPPGVTALDVTVGGAGQAGTLTTAGLGGWPNGGAGGSNASAGAGAAGGGGGSSDIRPSGAPFTSALVVIGGAGGTGGYGGDYAGGPGGWGGLNGAGFGQAGSGTGSDGGAGGAGGNQPNASTGQGGTGQATPNTNSGSGGGGGGGWNGGAGGAAGTADTLSFFRGGGGGGGGGSGSIVDQYATEISEYSGNANAFVQVSYLAVRVSPDPVPTLQVGTPASWTYDAGPGATHALTSGSLPPGLTFDGYSGEIQGVPTQFGVFTFAIESTIYPNGANAVSTITTTTVTVDSTGPASLAATSASAIGTTTATANGAVLAGGTPVTGIRCVYSTTNPGSGAITGTAVAASPATVTPQPTIAPTAVSCPLTGLTSDQTYYYQVQGTQGGGPVRSGTASFRTNSAPAQPVTLAATNVRGTTATGRGTVSATQAVTGIFCRAATTLDGLVTNTGAITATATPASTTESVSNRAVSCAFTGLTENAVYHYAVFATTAGTGTTMSPNILSFRTRATPPQLGIVSASAVGSTTAVIRGTVTATNEDVTLIACRYVPSPGNPTRGPAVTATPSQTASTAANVATTCTLTGLTPSTTYLVRMEATDQDGTAGSPNVVRFTTASAAPNPTVSITSAFALGAKRVRARATINGPGTLTLLASRATTRTNRRAQVCRANRTIAGGGTYTITCSVGQATRRVQRTRRVPIRIRVTFTPVEGPAVSATVNVLLPRVAPPRRGTR